MSNVNATTFTIVVVLFVIVTGVGFAAARWRRAENMMHLDEWGLGGRGFGTFVTWFLIGGDLYTAYTFIAVPALVGFPGARLRHARRLHPRQVRFARAGSGRRLHRHPGPHAVHRAATGRHPGRADCDGSRHVVDEHIRQGLA